MKLERVLEPEVMDSIQEACDYDEMDHTAVNQLFVDDLLAQGGIRGDVLDIGTGTARIPIDLCQRNEEVRVLGIDLSVGMLDVARNNVELSGLTDRIRLDRVDSKELPFESGRFPTVVSNSIVHHIADPSSVVREAVRVVAPGGVLFFRDLLRPSDEETLARLVRTYAANESDAAKKMFEDSLRASLDLEEVRHLVDQLGLDTASVRATSDRHWTWSVRLT